MKEFNQIERKSWFGFLQYSVTIPRYCPLLTFTYFAIFVVPTATKTGDVARKGNSRFGGEEKLAGVGLFVKSRRKFATVSRDLDLVQLFLRSAPFANGRKFRSVSGFAIRSSHGGRWYSLAFSSYRRRSDNEDYCQISGVHSLPSLDPCPWSGSFSAEFSSFRFCRDPLATYRVSVSNIISCIWRMNIYNSGILEAISVCGNNYK